MERQTTSVPSRILGFAAFVEGSSQSLNAEVRIGPAILSLNRLANSKYVAPGWDEVYGMMIGLAREIKDSDYSPQVIVGVSRGGWPPARIMSDLLENSNLANMRVEFYTNIGVTAKTPKITQPVTSEVTGRRVLVVDDVADSGYSLRVASRHLKQKGAREIKVCTLYMKPKSVFKPDHFARSTTKWVIFPWERLEAVKLIRKNLGLRGTPTNVIRELKGSGLNSLLVRRLIALDNDN